jgi:RNA polymerase sigma-70 factor, ECF subfamily
MDRFEFDDDYVRRLREGDRETTEHFDRYFRDLMSASLHRRLSSKSEIDDVIQDVFARVYEHLHELRDGRALGAFVNGFRRNVLLEHYRDNQRSMQLADPLDEPDPVDHEEALHIIILKAQVRRELAELEKHWPEEAALLRADLDDEDRDELCRRLGITSKNLRVRLHRARKKFLERWRRRRKS